MAQETSRLATYDEGMETEPIARCETEPERNSETENLASEETERLHSAIEVTRENMSETIDAIQERLSLSNLSEQVSEKVSDVLETAKDTVYDATLGKMVNFMKQARDGVMQTSAGRTVMANPIPFALIGAGSALLLYNCFGKDGRSRGHADYRTKEYFAPIEGSEEPASTAKKISDQASATYKAASDKAGSTLDAIGQKASDTYAGATDIANRAYDKVGEIGTAAKENYDHYVEEKPLAVAAVAMAVGAAVGFVLPSTNYESKLMGEARDNVIEKAEDTATEFVDKAKQVASDASHAVSKELGSTSPGTQTS